MKKIYTIIYFIIFLQIIMIMPIKAHINYINKKINDIQKELNTLQKKKAQLNEKNQYFYDIFAYRLEKQIEITERTLSILKTKTFKKPKL